MDINEFINNPSFKTLLEDAFTTIIDGAGTIRFEDGGLDEDDDTIAYVSIKDMDLEAHIGLSRLGAFTVLRSFDALNALALMYVIANEEEIAANGGNPAAMVRELSSNLKSSVNG